MVEAVSVLLAVIAAGIGIAIGWLVNSKNLIERVSRAEATVEAERATNEERLKQMQLSFEKAATEAFKTAVKKADDEKESSFSDATKALSNDLNEYAKAIQSAKEADIKRAAQLGEKVDNVSKLGISLADETRELTLALRGDSQAQGAWGEVAVENLLQNMGFVEGRDYIKQLSETNEDRTRKRTDFILNLPNNRQIVIDSKVSLTAYTEYVKYTNEGDQDAANAAIQAHCKSIANHAKNLASKNYEHMEAINSLDFVLMVIPIQSAFEDAMRADTGLYADVVGDRRVKVVSGVSFMLALQLIQEMWARENQTRNQIEIVKRGGSLHDKIVTFLESFTTVGFEIGQAKNAYDQARNQLVEGPGNVVRQTEILRDLGVKSKKELRNKSGVKSLAEEAEMNEHAISPTEMVIVEAEEE
ncbi:MAG: DNA recombination protein RmuC [Candidatus Thalassarchaeaceae archaeon]|jgi:DNA recombination protein RmuC|nr:DNA recombination protein RmuC [Candidatus Thalassarchaeaceae archaeon]